MMSQAKRIMDIQEKKSGKARTNKARAKTIMDPQEKKSVKAHTKKRMKRYGLVQDAERMPLMLMMCTCRYVHKAWCNTTCKERCNLKVLQHIS